MRLIYLLLIPVLMFTCQSDDELQVAKLDDYVAQYSIAKDSVIACAAGRETADLVDIFFYPRPGATEFYYFETDSINVDENNYENYRFAILDQEDVFNGYLKKFIRPSSEEKWVIVSFMENGIMNLSQPIRLKHKSQNTVFVDTLAIDQTMTGMPVFDWSQSANALDVIYFQVISDTDDNFLSGTYTVDSNFKYYDLDNVVLNVTRELPPALIIDDTYTFTLMGVSQDNWVNTLIQTEFVVTP